MTELLNRYRELVAQTQLYLHREYAYQSMLTVDPKLFADYPKQVPSATPVPKILGKEASAAAYQPAPIRDILPLPLAHVPPPKPPITPQKLVTPAPSKRNERIEPPATPSQTVPIAQKEMTNSGSNAKHFALEPFLSQAPQDLSDYWKLHRQLFPEKHLTETIPKDCVALKVKNAWQNEQTIPTVVIICFREVEKELVFLKNVAQAISLRLAPARVISAAKWEKENGWDSLITASTLRLVIATDYDLYMQPALMKVYRESPQQGKHFLQQVPLLLLSDISLYLKEPQLKSLLWRAICNEFASPQSTPT